jgi:geranylgeranyl diphosphate synthase type II
MMDVKSYLTVQRERVDAALDRLLPPETTYPPSLYKAMRYSLFSGGKRLRPILALAACSTVGGEEERIIPFACALELIQTYSLIHDDLPAMDDDDYRRGKLANHRVFGEGIAILAGDALLTEAFSLMTQPEHVAGLDGSTVLLVVNEVSAAVGGKGMVGGQVVDLESERVEVDFRTVEWIHVHKTAAFLRSAVRTGSLLGGADGDRLEALTRYGADIGLAFQIADDILNIEGSQEELGKKVGTDAERGKQTYPDFLGMEASRAKAKELVDDAVAALQAFDKRAEPLRAIARFIIERRS